jgi:hypothetical protein
VKPIIGSTPVSLVGAGRLIDKLMQTLFIGQGIPGPSLTDHYQLLWEWMAVVLAAAALAAAAYHRRQGELATMAWIVVSVPLGVITVIVLGFSQSGTEATLAARFLDCLLPLFSILIGYGAVALLGSRLGSLALLSALVAGSFLEVTADRTYVQATYTADIISHSVPVAEQAYADSTDALTRVRASSNCRADAVAVAMFGSAPSMIAVNGHDSTGPPVHDNYWFEYHLMKPVEGNFTVAFPRPVLAAVARHRGPFVGPYGRVATSSSGLPAVRLYCPTADSESVRFNQLYPTNHPQLSEGTLLAWPEVEAWVEVVLVAAVAVGVALSIGVGGIGSGDDGGHHRRRSDWSSN